MCSFPQLTGIKRDSLCKAPGREKTGASDRCENQESHRFGGLWTGFTRADVDGVQGTVPRETERSGSPAIDDSRPLRWTRKTGQLVKWESCS